MYQNLCKVGQRVVTSCLAVLLVFPAVRAESEQIINSGNIIITDQKNPKSLPKEDGLEQEEEKQFSQETNDGPLGDEPQTGEEVESETEPIIQEVVEQETGSGDGDSEKETGSENTEEKKSENEDLENPMQEESFFQKCRKVASECYDVVSTFVTDNKIPCSIVGGIVTLYAIAFSIVTVIFVKHVNDYSQEYGLDTTVAKVKNCLGGDITFWKVFRHPFRAWTWFVAIDQVKQQRNYSVFKDH